MLGTGQQAFAACSGPQVLTPQQWQEDIAQAVTRIREVHPDPFQQIDEADFDAAAAQLRLDAPCLDDKAIVVRLSALVALLRDGHTRLAIPKQHAGLGLSIVYGIMKEYNGALGIESKVGEGTSVSLYIPLLDG